MMEHREKIRRKKSKTAAFCPPLAKLRAATKENGEDIMNICRYHLYYVCIVIFILM